MKLKLLDLFSGIGGFSLGLESTGYFKTIAFVEKDKFCQQVLKKNFKNIPIESEVRNVKGDRYAADIITGGFPCQPFSVAGKRRGTDDDRYLWDETIRIIRECKPRWFIGENVEGIINIQEGMVLRQVQDDLEKEGFQVQCLVIPASGIGAWHQRKRVWILAYSEHNGSHRSKGNETIESSNQSKEWLFIGDDKDVSNSNSRLSIGENEEVQARRYAINSICKSRKQTWWQTQSKLCGVPYGVSYELDKDRTNRIKALGNSIVPLIARELGLAIMKAEQDG
jgi:DNA (cytosine-5)-methyltransferase 1